MLKFCCWHPCYCWHPGCCWPHSDSIYLAWPMPSVVEQGRDSGITGPVKNETKSRTILAAQKTEEKKRDLQHTRTRENWNWNSLPMSVFMLWLWLINSAQASVVPSVYRSISPCRKLAWHEYCLKGTQAWEIFWLWFWTLYYFIVSKA